MDNENVQPVATVTGLNRGTFGGYTSPVFGIRIAEDTYVRE
jgi:hypothetical protein